MPLVLPLSAVRSGDLPLVGGKGANLGELAASGFPIPDGFCITTEAFAAYVQANELDGMIARAISSMVPDDPSSARGAGEAIREAFVGGTIPPDLRREIVSAWRHCGMDHAYAVRSSATAEDLPDASFAGQQDTYLNIRGESSLLEHTVACFASLYTERAIVYRAKNRMTQNVRLCVVVQRMVQADRAGILFTADPVSQRRGTTSIDAGYGLGEALVSGLITPDVYRVDARGGTILERRIGEKALAIQALPEGGTVERPVTPDMQRAQVLTDAEILELSALASLVEAHYGKPQDIEWAFEGSRLFLTQSRPITTLLPLPEDLLRDSRLRLLLSFNYLQVMTDPLSPLGVSVLRHVAAGTVGYDGDPESLPATIVIGHRLWFDASEPLSLPMLHHRALPILAKMIDPALAARIAEVTKRPTFVRTPSRATRRIVRRLARRIFLPTLMRVGWNLLVKPPTQFLPDAVRAQQTTRAATDEALARVGEPRGILAAVNIALKQGLRHSVPVIGPLLLAAKISQAQLERQFRGTTHERDVAALERGLAGNVTTAMDLAVGDLCDVALSHPALRTHVEHGGTLVTEALRQIEGGADFLQARQVFLESYGARGAGEIDLARPRLWEDDATLTNIVRGALARKVPGDHRVRHAALAQEAALAVSRLEAAVNHGPFGALKVRQLRRRAAVLRAGLALREHPKESLVEILWRVKKHLLALGETLSERGAIADREDVTILTLSELDAVERGALARPELDTLISARRQSLERARSLPCPPVLTSEGEIVSVARDLSSLPRGALVGMAVSSGVVEGVAHVIHDPGREVLAHGEILVARATDPGWTPLFLNTAGLVMEVGGVMTHGSVIAREYGLPAVVGVEGATARIRTGQRVRVDGDRGIVEIL
ncbi:MAG: phosphoenolpyruvate synthase [Spirochaetes bacterium]|nr:phosphoenolpyruvate synthase [Spirochaetota bacterium]